MASLDGLVLLAFMLFGFCIVFLSLYYMIKMLFLEEKILRNHRHKNSFLLRLEMILPFVISPTNDPDRLERRRLFSKYLLCFVVFGALLLVTLLIVQPSSAP